MAAEVAVPAEIAYVALVAASTVFVHGFFSSKVVAARMKFNVLYPTMYAVESENKDAKAFNCVQRGHQNFLELLPIFLALITFGGLQHPRLAAIFGLCFLAARVLYFLDYSTGDPKKRMRGALLGGTSGSVLTVALGISLIRIGGYTFIMMLVFCNISFAVHQLIL